MLAAGNLGTQRPFGNGAREFGAFEKLRSRLVIGHGQITAVAAVFCDTSI